MSDWMPGAVKKPITKHYRARTGGARVNAQIDHIAVSNADSLYGFFSGAGVCAHMYVRRSGVIEQYMPAWSKSKSERVGNNRTFSVETQGGFGQEPWTPQQVKSLAAIARWMHDDHSVPLSLMANSHTHTAGIGYHRLGIDGNFPHDALFGGRQERGGGESWSFSRGKTCPDNSARPADSVSRIAQMPEIIALAIEGHVGFPPTNPGTPSVPGGYGLDLDGWWGSLTTFALQDYLSTEEDGVVSRQGRVNRARNPGLTSGWDWTGRFWDNGSLVIRALQSHLLSKGFSPGRIDGRIGPNTIRALQRYLGTNADGELWDQSPAIAALQARLNAATL